MQERNKGGRDGTRGRGEQRRRYNGEQRKGGLADCGNGRSSTEEGHAKHEGAHGSTKSALGEHGGAEERERLCGELRRGRDTHGRQDVSVTSTQGCLCIKGRM